MKLKIQNIFSQRDSRWASVLLGFNTSQPYTIGNYGCLITSLGMYINKTPDLVNQILKDNNGFVNGGNFVWSKCTALGLTQTYVSAYYDGPVSPQGITKIKELLDGGYPLLCEIDFNPATEGEEMHFVLLGGYDGESIFAYDPWTGQYINLDIYGGPKRAIIQFRAYDKILQKDVQIDLQSELDQCRKDRDDNWNKFVAVCTALGVGANVDLAVVEAKKLSTLEDQYNQKDKQLQTVQQQLSDVQAQVQKLQTDLSGVQDQLNVKQGELEQKLKENSVLQQTVIDKTNEVSNLSGRITELQNAILAPVRKGWKSFLVSLIDKI